jgi:hypothetical protein
MMKKVVLFSLLQLTIILLSSTALAHVPYFEHKDFSENNPFQVRKSIEQSIAVYSWLENDGINPCDDFDVFKFDIKKPSRVYIESIVPKFKPYANFTPWFAVLGPNFPASSYDLPFEIPEGYGAIVKEDVEPGNPRETFFEFFGGKSYYQGPIFDKVINESGTYYVYYWDPYGYGGDYVAILGKKEMFGFTDILRALIYTPLIRLNLELHLRNI